MKNKFDSFIGLAKSQELTKTASKKGKPAGVPEDTNFVPPVKRGRPNGKRSDQTYKQVTAYINLDTYKKTKIRLFEEDNKQEFSELVDALLQKWLKEK